MRVSSRLLILQSCGYEGHPRNIQHRKILITLKEKLSKRARSNGEYLNLQTREDSIVYGRFKINPINWILLEEDHATSRTSQRLVRKSVLLPDHGLIVRTLSFFLPKYTEIMFQIPEHTYLVSGSCNNITILKRVRYHRSSHKPADVSHIHHQKSTN